MGGRLDGWMSRWVGWMELITMITVNNVNFVFNVFFYKVVYDSVCLSVCLSVCSFISPSVSHIWGCHYVGVPGSTW